MKALVAGLMILTTSVCAAENRLMFGLGTGDVAVPRALVTDSTAGDNTLALSAYFGHTFDSGVIADVGLTAMTDDVFFGANDNVRFGALEALFGYRLQYDQIYMEPKIGYSRWRRTVEEGQFLNPGSEYKRSDNGGDPLYMLTIGYRLSESFGLSLSYKYQELNDRKADAVLLGFGFPF